MIEEHPPRVAAFKSRLISEIPCVPDKVEVRRALGELSLPRLLIQYFNWSDRLLPPRPRRTIRWHGFHEHSAHSFSSPALMELEKLSEKGERLDQYLSRQAYECGYVQRPSPKRGVFWGDKDLALNAYDVHHLHLVAMDKHRRRPGGSRTLLFATLSRTNMVPLMIGDHNSFDDGTLFKAVTAFRAATGLVLRGVEPPREGDGFTQLEKAKLIRSGFMITGETAGSVVPTAMLSNAGTSLLHTRHSSRVLQAIAQWEAWLDDHAKLSDLLEGATWLPQRPQWEWRCYFSDLCITETTTGNTVLVLPWVR